MRKMTRIIGVIAVAALSLSACGAGGNEAGSGGADVKVSEMNKHDRSELEDGGTLRLALDEMPENWNNSTTQGNGVSLSDIYGWVAPANFLVNAKGELVIRKEFLESFEEEGGKGEKPLKVTLNLNKKAVWNNGTPITVDDYVAAWKACNGENAAFNCASIDGWDKVESVEKGTDEFQVVVKFKTAYPDWKGVLVAYTNAEGTSDPEVFNNGWAGNAHPEWLAGPFTIESVDQNGASPRVVLTRNNKWWGETPRLDKIIYTVYDSNARTTAFINKEIDSIRDIITADEYKIVQNREDAAVSVTPGTQYRTYTLNSTSGAFTDKAVRQAFMYALNRDEIKTALQSGLPVPPDSPKIGNHFLLPGQEYYQNNGPDYDLEKAKKILDDAGWKLPEGKTVREKDGQPLQVKLTDWGSDVASTAKENQIAQSMLAEAGFDAQLDTADSSKFAQILSEGQFQALSFTWQGTPFPYGGAKQIYSCPVKDDKGNESWGGNYSRICDPVTTPLLDSLKTEVDPAERAKIGNDLDKILWENVYNVPMYQRPFIWASRKDLANFGPALFETPVPENVGFIKQK